MFRKNPGNSTSKPIFTHFSITSSSSQKISFTLYASTAFIINSSSPYLVLKTLKWNIYTTPINQKTVLLITFTIQVCQQTEFQLANGSCISCPANSIQHPNNVSICDCGENATFSTVETNQTTNGTIFEPPKNITIISGLCTPCPEGQFNFNASNVCQLPPTVVCTYFTRVNNKTFQCIQDTFGLKLSSICFAVSFLSSSIVIIIIGVVFNKRAGVGTKYKRRNQRWKPGTPVGVANSINVAPVMIKERNPKSETEKQRIKRENKELKEQVKKEKREQAEIKHNETMERKRAIIASRREQRIKKKDENASQNSVPPSENK